VVSLAAVVLVGMLLSEAGSFFYVRKHWRGGEPLLYSVTRMVLAAVVMPFRLAFIWYLLYQSVLPFGAVLAAALTFLALLGPPRDLGYTKWGASRDAERQRWQSDPMFRDWLIVSSWSTAWVLQLAAVLLLAREVG
jgi:hypothetical protein